VVVFLPDEVTMEEVGQNAQLRAGEIIIIVVVLIMWAGELWTITTSLEPCFMKDGKRYTSPRFTVRMSIF